MESDQVDDPAGDAQRARRLTEEAAEAAEKVRRRWIALLVGPPALIMIVWAGVIAFAWYEREHGSPEAKARRKLEQATREQREQADKRAALEKECADKGLRFAGTVGDQVQCRP